MNKRSGWIRMLTPGSGAGAVSGCCAATPGTAQGVRPSGGLISRRQVFVRAAPAGRFPFHKMTAPTPEFQTEWLYYTGNVYTAEAGHSFPLTFFPSGQLRKAA